MVAKSRFKATVWLVLAVLVLAGCSRHIPAPISSRPPPPTIKIDHHRVSAGETLYSIAWRYDLDHRKLAAANGIAAPYTIYAGQRLTLDLSKARTMVAASAAGSGKKTPAANRKTTEQAPGANSRSPSKPQPKSTSKKAPESKPSVAKTPVRQTPTATALPKTWKWRWPVKGKVQRHYDSNKRFKGIHIQSARGTGVKAAGPGIVVYAGNGLHSYGRSIIIKHSDVYLSFYALNRRLLVKEGDTVAAGQKIAEVGGDVNDPNRIYFEIRRDGNSVDPIRLLPKP